ncbi:hypothetical protein DERP_002922 [Dermatophagoides pteronyssinus]|uniref:Uncharacterized protein n=1 Tax=Dermatophagoides pteronyssinus TaxID=6956 RepID=A0ABQ8JX49_DERPT|nr:hypothetical protein DERP_002922 [Dermatophagoides pteronyssinus]
MDSGFLIELENLKTDSLYSILFNENFYHHDDDVLLLEFESVIKYGSHDDYVDHFFYEYYHQKPI